MAEHTVYASTAGDTYSVSIKLSEDKWARSDFPDPLMTIDYDANDKVIGVGALGSLAPELLNAYTDWFKIGRLDDVDKFISDFTERAKVWRNP